MKNSITNYKAIAVETLKALGGNRFIAMTGATVSFDCTCLVVKFKGCRKANIMYVTLNGLDLYDVKICKYTNPTIHKSSSLTTVYATNNLYCDQLQSTFTQVTGLYTHL